MCYFRRKTLPIYFKWLARIKGVIMLDMPLWMNNENNWYSFLKNLTDDISVCSDLCYYQLRLGKKIYNAYYSLTVSDTEKTSMDSICQWTVKACKSAWHHK